VVWNDFPCNYLENTAPLQFVTTFSIKNKKKTENYSFFAEQLSILDDSKSDFLPVILIFLE